MTKESHPARPDEEAHWERLARYFGGESPPHEADEVREWLDSNPREAMAFSGLERIVSDAATVPEADLDVEAALKRSRAARRRPFVRSRQTQRAALRWSRWSQSTGLRAAAALAVFVSGALVYRSFGGVSATSSSARVFHGSAAGPDTVRLTDGSSVVLAPRSRLTVPSAFGLESREVSLIGLGYFDVVHDARRPFVVRTWDAEVRDLGTAFAVRADSAQPLHVSVQTGVVHVTDAASPRGVTLYAGDQATMGPSPEVARGSGRSLPEGVVAWTSGRLVFRDVPMHEVAREVYRWFGVELRTQNGLATRLINTEFDDSGTEVMIRSLSVALGATAEQRGDTVFLRPEERAPR